MCYQGFKEVRTLGTMYATFEMRNGLQQSANLTGTEQYYLHNNTLPLPALVAGKPFEFGILPRTLTSFLDWLLTLQCTWNFSEFIPRYDYLTHSKYVTLLILVFPSKRPTFVIGVLPRFSNALSMHHRRQKVLISRTLL